MAKIPIDDPQDAAGRKPEEEPEAKATDSPDTAADVPDDEAPSDDDLIAEAEAIVEEAAADAGAEGAADADAADADAEGASPADQLAAAQAQAQEWQDRYLRLHAEWDTYRRRMGEQRAEEKARATEGLMEDLLPVLDDFERTVAYADENGETGLLDGVKAVQTKLLDALAKSGLVMIDPAGEPYDALEAQAVQMVSDDEAYDETVRDVYQKGYRMGKKVLRPAMVTVTTGGPKRPKPEESEEE